MINEGMARLFSDFDFTLLDDPDFREDSVREALVVPLPKALGFTESPPYRIIRSRPLTHSYVYIGTVKKGITIIPDYLLHRDGESAWILDAKGPKENIDSGKNVEQAYSYAIHPDIRVPFYGLCNGRKLVVFNISFVEPVIDVHCRVSSTSGLWFSGFWVVGQPGRTGPRLGSVRTLGWPWRKPGLRRTVTARNIFTSSCQ